MKVAIPSTPADAKGLLAAAIRDPDPVVILEPKLLYRTTAARCRRASTSSRSGRRGWRARATTSRSSRTARWCRSPSRPRTRSRTRRRSRCSTSASLKPLDEEALLASAAKTGRVVIVQEAPRTAGYAAELAAILAEKAILDLHGPVLRVTGYDVPYPYWKIEDAYMPSVERVVDAARRLLEF